MPGILCRCRDIDAGKIIYVKIAGLIVVETYRLNGATHQDYLAGLPSEIIAKLGLRYRVDTFSVYAVFLFRVSESVGLRQADKSIRLLGKNNFVATDTICLSADIKHLN